MPRGGANDDGDGAAVVEAAPRDVVEAPEEDRDGEVYLDVHFDPLKALASAARALRRALASLFGGGGKSASGASASADAPSAVEAACPGALATAARAARRALATGRPVLVVAAPPASAAAEELAAAVKALGSDAVLLDATRTAQTYARAAKLASAAMPAALPKNAPFCALAVPAYGPLFQMLQSRSAPSPRSSTVPPPRGPSGTDERMPDGGVAVELSACCSKRYSRPLL